MVRLLFFLCAVCEGVILERSVRGKELSNLVALSSAGLYGSLRFAGRAFFVPRAAPLGPRIEVLPGSKNRAKKVGGMPEKCKDENTVSANLKPTLRNGHHTDEIDNLMEILNHEAKKSSHKNLQQAASNARNSISTYDPSSPRLMRLLQNIPVYVVVDARGHMVEASELSQQGMGNAEKGKKSLRFFFLSEGDCLFYLNQMSGRPLFQVRQTSLAEYYRLTRISRAALMRSWGKNRAKPRNPVTKISRPKKRVLQNIRIYQFVKFFLTHIKDEFGELDMGPHAAVYEREPICKVISTCVLVPELGSLKEELKNSSSYYGRKITGGRFRGSRMLGKGSFGTDLLGRGLVRLFAGKSHNYLGNCARDIRNIYWGTDLLSTLAWKGRGVPLYVVLREGKSVPVRLARAGDSCLPIFLSKMAASQFMHERGSAAKKYVILTLHFEALLELLELVGATKYIRQNGCEIISGRIVAGKKCMERNGEEKIDGAERHTEEDKIVQNPLEAIYFVPEKKMFKNAAPPARIHQNRIHLVKHIFLNILYTLKRDVPYLLGYEID